MSTPTSPDHRPRQRAKRSPNWRPTPTVADDLAAVLADLFAMRSQCFIPNDGDWWDTKARKALDRYQDERGRR